MKFGIDSTDLDSTADAVGTVLGVAFIPHESDWRGGGYFRATTSCGTIFLQRNLDVLDDEPFEPDWPVDQVIMYFDMLSPEELETYTERLGRLETPFVVELN